jgi:hypothetical protein
MYTLIGHTDIEAGEERAMAPLKRVLCAWCISHFHLFPGGSAFVSSI